MKEGKTINIRHVIEYYYDSNGKQSYYGGILGKRFVKETRRNMVQLYGDTTVWFKMSDLLKNKTINCEIC